MIKICYILLFIIITSQCYSQKIFKEYKGEKEEYILNFVFKNCKIKNNNSKEIILFDQKFTFENFKIKTKIPIQTKKRNGKIKGKLSNRRIKLGFNFKLDSGYIFFDTISSILKKEINDKISLITENNKEQDNFESETCGMFLANENYFMYIKTKNLKAEPCYILWYNTKIYYLEITGRRKSYDALLSFILNAFAVKTNTNNNSLINGYKFVNIKSLSLISQIADELKLKYTRKPINKKK